MKSGKPTCEANGVEFQEFIVGNDGLAFGTQTLHKCLNLIAHIAAALAAECRVVVLR